MSRIRFVDELGHGFGWIEDAPLQRTSHALASGEAVWVIDPIEGAGVDERIRELGEPAGVIQLLDRHDRACAAFAERLAVPLHVVPQRIYGAPFVFLPILGRRLWSEVALWWPERRTLVCADALGTVPHYFRVDGERVGVHPLLRLTPPRALLGLAPEHVLVGHGEGASAVGPHLDTVLARSRRRVPAWIVGLRHLRRHRPLSGRARADPAARAETAPEDPPRAPAD